jgi:hypothetical protein
MHHQPKRVALALLLTVGASGTALAGTTVDPCTGLSGGAQGLCNAYCNAQNCPANPDTNSCTVLRRNFQNQTGSSTFPCDTGAVATATRTVTRTRTATALPGTMTPTVTAQETSATATGTAPAPTGTRTATPEATGGSAATETATFINTPHATVTANPTGTRTGTPVATGGGAATATAAPTGIPTGTANATVTATAGATGIPTGTASVTAVTTTTPTATMSCDANATVTATFGGATATATGMPAGTATATATGVPTGTAAMTVTPGPGQDACAGLSGSAFGLCNAFCNAQDCPSDPGPSCEVLRQNYAAQTGSSIFPCELGSQTPGSDECMGDCAGDGVVDVSDLMRGVLIMLGAQDESECTIWVRVGHSLQISDLIIAVNNALDGCG